MKWVTKKEYESALATIERALKNKQLKSMHYDIIAEEVNYAAGQDVFDADSISFIAPPEAAKDRLFSLRKQLKEAREKQDEDRKSIEVLESEERKLAQALPTLKDD
jgi:hypothetical protein